MKRSVVLMCLFALFLAVGQVAGSIPALLVEWKWDDKSPSLAKTGKQISGKDTYKLSASGIIIFGDKQGTVNESKTKYQVFVADTGTNLYPLNPTTEFKVTVGPQTKLPPTELD